MQVEGEAKAYALIRAGYDGSGPDSEAYSSIFFQNANNSVRVNDEFMRAYERDGEFSTLTVKDRKVVNTYKARDIMAKIAEATWQCGDPGMQFDSTINRWHTSKNSGRINASNPCSEYMFLDNSACNLASFNLLKFMTGTGTFDIQAYRHGVSVMITAMDIWWITRVIRPSRSPRTLMIIARWDWAMPTLARADGLRPAL